MSEYVFRNVHLPLNGTTHRAAQHYLSEHFLIPFEGYRLRITSSNFKTGECIADITVKLADETNKKSLNPTSRDAAREQH